MELRPVLIVSAAFFLAAATPQQIPDRISRADTGQPLWVAASAALTSTGQLRSDVFGDDDATNFDADYGPTNHKRKASNAARVSGADAAPVSEVIQIHSDEQCNQMSSIPMGDYAWYDSDRVIRTASTAALATNSIGIYEGTVSQTASGFSGRQPGTLAHLVVTRTIKASPDVDARDGLLVFHDYARFGLGKYTFCVGYRPLAAGDRALLFVLRPPSDEKRQLILDNDQIIIEHEGQMSLPATTPAESELRSAKTLADVMRVVERELKPEVHHAH